VSHIRKLVAIALVSLCSFTAAQNNVPEISEEMLDKARNVSDVVIPKDIEQKVQSLMETLNGEQWQKNFQQMRGDVATMLDIESNEVVKRANKNDLATAIGPTDRLYVFISSSVPLNTLRNYAKDIEKVPGAIMVLRGFINSGHKIKPTASFFADIAKKDPDCQGQRCEMRKIEIQIDPFLFRRFSINSVPAVAFETNVEGIGYCGLDVDTPPTGTSNNVVYGDASLLYAVEQLYELSKEPRLHNVINRLEPKV